MRNMTFHHNKWAYDWGHWCYRCRRRIFEWKEQLHCSPEGTAGCDFDLKKVTCFNKGEVDGKMKVRLPNYNLQKN